VAIAHVLIDSCTPSAEATARSLITVSDTARQRRSRTQSWTNPGLSAAIVQQSNRGQQAL